MINILDNYDQEIQTKTIIDMIDKNITEQNLCEKYKIILTS